MKTTRKATRIIGERSYTDNETGEVLTLHVVEAEERDCNFHKLWLEHILQTLDIIGNRKIKVINYIMENLTQENLFIHTQAQITETLSISKKTVGDTFLALLESDFLTKVQNGVYRVNPEVIFKGGRQGRLNVLIKYSNEKKDTAKTDNSQQELENHPDQASVPPSSQP